MMHTARETNQSKFSLETSIDKVDKPLSASDEEVTELDLDELAKERLGWKKIFLLPFEPVWEYLILVFGYLNAIGLLTLASTSEALLFSKQVSDLGFLFDTAFFLDDVFLIGCKIMPDLPVPPVHALRPNWVIFLELCSVIPLQLVIERKKDSSGLIRLSTAIELLRLPRCMFHFYYNRKMVGNKKVVLLFVQALFSSSLLMALTFFVLYCMTCLGQDCPYRQSWMNFEDATSAVTNNGFYESDSKLDQGKLIVTIAAACSYFGVIIPTIGELVTVTISAWKHKYMFMYQIARIKKTLRDNKISHHVCGRVTKFYDIFWKKRYGYSTDTLFLNIFPPAMRTELATDISWYALKHSKIFRSMDLPFLRAVALIMEQKFATAGEYLYQKGKNKNRMIYIVSGIAQVISEEDGETPLISFSAGTCLGEISLIVNYNSSFSVICKEYCEIHVLEMKNFVAVLKCFPKQAHRIRKMVHDRIESGKQMKQISIFNNAQHGIDAKDTPTLMWINSTLHRLMRRNEESSKHDYQNIFLKEDLDKQMFDQMHFTARNLDLLAITERIELVTDTVFIKTSFPCIFRPNSVVLQAWDIIVCVICLLMGFLIPYYALVEYQTPSWHRTAMILLTITYWLDVYLQMSTAVRTKEELIVSIKSIFIHRLENIDFVLDIVAAYPIEMYSSVIISKPHSQSFACLYLNRVIKMWKLKTVLAKYEGISTTQVISFAYLKYVFIYGYIIYLSSCLMYSANCFYGKCVYLIPGETTVKKLIWVLVPATQIVTGAGLQGSMLNGVEKFEALCCVMMYVSLFVYIQIIIEVTTIHTLPRFPLLEMQALFLEVKSLLLAHNALQTFKNRLKSYIITQWKQSEAQSFIISGAVMQELPLQIYGSIKEDALSNVIKNQQLFMGLSDEVIYHLCIMCEIKTFPPKTVLAYAGQMDDTVYLIIAGECDIISPITRQIEKRVGPGASIGVLEVFTRTVIADTSITATHTKILSFNFFKLMGVLTRFPAELATFKEALAHCKLYEKLAVLQKTDQRLTYDLDYDENNMKSFHMIGYGLTVDSDEEYDYYIPFDRLGLFSFIRLFLMRLTIMPGGRFLFIWETCRWIFAVASSLLYVINPIVFCDACAWAYLLRFLDMTAWADIYLRFHVGFYDENGILVTHPLKTAKYYLKHSFCVDVLAVFPFEYFLVTNTFGSYQMLTVITCNRLLQLYRFFGYYNLIGKDILQHSKLAGIFRHFPCVLIICNTLAAFQSNIDCDYHPQIPASKLFTAGVTCQSDSFISNSNFSVPYSPLNVHIIALYFTTASITMIGLQGYQVTSLSDSCFQAAYSFIGAFLLIYILGNINALYSAKYSSLRYYQEGMNSVKEFLKRNKVADRVYRNFIKHYEINWRKKRGKDLHYLVKNFDKALYEDVLYHVYGKILDETSIFKENCEAFYRMLLPKTRHEIVINGNTLASVNDVKSKLHIIVNGCFDVIAPDGTKLTTLHVGSMLGNLDNYPRVRQTVGYVANGHCEVLSIDAIRFHKILQLFPALNLKFKRLTIMHIDYLKGRVTNTDREMTITVLSSQSNTVLDTIKTHVFHPESKFIVIWKLLILFVVCYIAPMLSIYTMAFNMYCIPCYSFEYFCDILFAIDFYIQYHTAYESDTGVMVRDIILIRKKQNKEKLHVVLSILCTIPYDVVIWFTPLTFMVRNRVIEWFRLTKIYRIVLIFKYFRQQEQRLDMNVLLMQLIYLVFVITLTLHCFTCIIVVLGCFGVNNLNPPIKCEYIISEINDPYEDFTIYYKHLYIAIMCFVKCAQGNFHPVSYAMIIFFTNYMIVNIIFSSLVQIQIFRMAKVLWHVQGKYERLIDRVLCYMEKESASVIIINRLWMYVRLLWKKQIGINYPVLIENAPANLKAIVLNRCFEHHIKKNIVFKKCHEDFIRQVVPFFESHTYFPGDYIVFKGTVNNCMYFIHEGEVLVIAEDAMYKEDIVGRLKIGQYFGMLQGINTIPHEYSFRCSEISIVLQLNKMNWGYLLDYFPASNQTISEIIDNYTGW